MGYKEYLAASTRKKEKYDIEKGVAKKDLWGSVGATLGGIAATALTGGAAAPWAVGLAAGGGTFLGGAIGRSKGGSLTKDKTLLRKEALELQKQKGAFGTENIIGALKAGLTAGIGQKLALGKQATSAETAAGLRGETLSDEALKSIRKGKGFDFGGSLYGKAIAKGEAFEKAAFEKVGQGFEKVGQRLESFKTGRELQQMGEGAIGTTKSIVGDLSGGDVTRTKLPPAGGYRERAHIPTEDIAGRVDLGRTTQSEEYLKSLERTNVLQPLTEGTTGSVTGTGAMGTTDQNIMGSLLEGWNESYGIKDVYGVGTGKGFDPSQISSQTSKSGFMAELELDRSLDKSLGRTFGLPSTERGYDYWSVSDKKAREMSNYSGLRSSIGGR